VFGELIGNVVRHTNGDAVDVALDLTAGSPVLHVLDRGPGFTYYARLPKDNMSESGRGLFIATALAKDLSVTPRIEGGSHARAVLAVKLRGV
jgi:anti-sigma regulatory factor (Ser/Thr protein kinase)